MSCYYIVVYEIIYVVVLILNPEGREVGGWGILPYMGYIGMCGSKGYGFSAVLVINRISILAICLTFGNK